MGLLNWIFGSNDSSDDEDGVSIGEATEPEDTEEDIAWIGPLAAQRRRECEENPSFYGQGQASAHFQVEDMRRYYAQYGYSSFQEAVQKSGEYWHAMAESEQELVKRGFSERQKHLEFALGQLSKYD